MKIFTDPSNLRKHIYRYHKAKESLQNAFICKYCHKQFNQKDSLKRHWNIHSNAHLKEEERKRWKCIQCDVRFAYKYNLNKHNKTYHQ